jgi:hypothetical protein
MNAVVGACRGETAPGLSEVAFSDDAIRITGSKTRLVKTAATEMADTPMGVLAFVQKWRAIPATPRFYSSGRMPCRMKMRTPPSGRSRRRTGAARDAACSRRSSWHAGEVSCLRTGKSRAS